MANQNIVETALHRTAAEVKKYRVWTKLLPIAIGALTIILVLIYIVALLYSRYGAFTVSVNKFDNLDYALTLSESPNFDTRTSRLNSEAEEEITNISTASLPDFLDNIDGKHNGENYVAYTFYCRNEGKKTVTYSYKLFIANMTLDIEKAVRVRLYVNGESTDYAYPRTDGGEGPEPGTTSFQAGNTIVKKEISNFKPGDVTKYTVVIWLEGDDPECLDNILGGQFKVDMEMTVMTNEDQAEQDN